MAVAVVTTPLTAATNEFVRRRRESGSTGMLYTMRRGRTHSQRRTVIMGSVVFVVGLVILLASLI